MSSDLTGLIISTILGWIAFSFGIAGCIPQSVRVLKTKDTQSISLSMYVLYCIGCVVWVIWSIGYTCEALSNLSEGLFAHDVTKTIIWFANLPTLFLNVICLALASIILTIKLINFLGSKKLKVSERDFVEQRWKKHG